jgi:pimeloyl-ACP methyl ester carboxylesterase
MIPRSSALERLVQRDERVAQAAQPILLAHEGPTARAVVLLHGLTASPGQFRRYAEALHARGHNVLVPRLPLHGFEDRMTTALAALTEEDLHRFSRDCADAAKVLGERATIAGFSAGGTLALWLAQHDAVDRVVAIAPFLGAAAIPTPLMGLATRALTRMPNWFVWWDPIRRGRAMPAHGYPRYPTHAMALLYRIAEEVMRGASLPPIAGRIAVVVNRGEASVSNRAIAKTIRRWEAVGARVERIELCGMPPSHDVIEPLRCVELAQRVFPAVLDAIDPVPPR